MDIEEEMKTVHESISAKVVFGDAIQQGDVVVIPAARVRGGGGAGGGTGPQNTGGSGSGFGLSAMPAGAFIVQHGRVLWRPAINANLIVAGGQLVAALGLVVLGIFLIRSGR